MGEYLMENKGEADRLEDQALQENYNLSDELKNFSFNDKDIVLDAGCGTGLLSRHLKSQIPSIDITGCDFSDIRVQQARQLAQSNGLDDQVTFRREDIGNLSFEDNTFDIVICRFVLEHLSDPISAMREFKRVLRPGGKLYIIDLDGIVFNLFTNNKRLNELLSNAQESLPSDMYIGRKLPLHCLNAGFEKVDWDASIMVFKGGELGKEIQNYRDRFYFAKDDMVKMLGSEEIYQEFVDLYLKELQAKGTTLFYNKFFVIAVKDS